MRWARAVVALGSVLLVLGFGLAVTPVPVVLDGQEQPCDLVLDPGTLAGQASHPETSTTAVERRRAARLDAACAPVERRAAWRAWGSLGLGALALLVGSAAVREVATTARPDVRRTGVPV